LSVPADKKPYSRQRLRDWFHNPETSWLHAVLIGREDVKYWSLGRAATTSLLAAAAFFFLGVVIAGVAGSSVFATYLSTPAVYIGFAGIAWVSFCGLWGDRNFRLLKDGAVHAFVQNDQSKEIFEGTSKRLFDPWRTLLVAVPCVVVAWIYVAYKTFDRHDLKLFPSEWSQGPALGAKNLILDVYGVGVIFLVVTMVEGALRFLNMVRKLAKLTPVFPLAVARERLRPVGRWGVWTGFAWSLALSTILLFFIPLVHDLRSRPSGGIVQWSDPRILVPAVVIGVMLGFSSALLIGPQLLLHGALGRRHQSLVNAAMKKVDAAVTGEARRDANSFLHFSDRPQAQLESHLMLIREGGSRSTWVLAGPGEVLVFAGTVVLPFATLLIGLTWTHFK
jgi:hypothetical protein